MLAYAFSCSRKLPELIQHRQGDSAMEIAGYVHDGETKPTALGRVPDCTIETLEDPLKLAFRQARPLVEDLD